MKILLAQDTYIPIIGGAEVHVAHLAEALRRLGHTVQIVTCTPGPPDEDLFRFPRRGSELRALWWLARYTPPLTVLIRRHDVVHAHYSYLLAAVSAVLCRLSGRRCVVTLHGLNTLDSSVRGSLAKRVLRRVSIALAHQVLATSKEMAEVARRYTSPGRITLVPNGVAVRQFDDIAELDPPAPPYRVLLLRRLVPKTGVQYVVDAAPRIVEALGGSVRFLIVGDGPMRPYLEQRARELGMAAYFEFAGARANNEVHEVLRDAHVVVFPSSAESTSIAALEAMAARRPVVASAVGALPELLGQGARGTLVSLFDRMSSDYRAPLTLAPDRINALADAVVDALTNRGPAIRRAHAAYEYVTLHHDWDVITQRVVAIYEAVRNRSRRMGTSEGVAPVPRGGTERERAEP